MYISFVDLNKVFYKATGKVVRWAFMKSDGWVCEAGVAVFVIGVSVKHIISPQCSSNHREVVFILHRKRT